MERVRRLTLWLPLFWCPLLLSQQPFSMQASTETSVIKESIKYKTSFKSAAKTKSKITHPTKLCQQIHRMLPDFPGQPSGLCHCRQASELTRIMLRIPTSWMEHHKTPLSIANHGHGPKEVLQGRLQLPFVGSLLFRSWLPSGV